MINLFSLIGIIVFAILLLIVFAVIAKNRRERIRRMHRQMRQREEEMAREEAEAREKAERARELARRTDPDSYLAEVDRSPESKPKSGAAQPVIAKPSKQAEAVSPATAQKPIEPKKTSEQQKPAEQPVIQVKNVCMTFKVASANTSGFKDYLIRRIKRQISHRELHALQNITFDAYKGEVIGIIGTNGSGKSTLLKIVSGALRPTSGEVIVDRSKIQLLTLGTGFDMELTARENIYLNGAIIGYSKRFLDEHFDEIIAFAELEGFVDEQVKNFSSGMVSRLGFAIATAGNAAEILILDEILSVGDEFFRKKSLARVKEMIHGGSTVLMVSHSLPSIRDNCSRVIWIEQGVQKMEGDPKTVCGAYQKYKQ